MWPSPTVRVLGANPPTPTRSPPQSLEGPPSTSVTGSECVRARGVLRKGRFPFHWGYFWLCCAVTVETARARFSVETSFSRAMYTSRQPESRRHCRRLAVSAARLSLRTHLCAWAAFLLKP